MDDLRERVQKAERGAEEMRRHNEALQARLDDSNKEQAKQEERIHEDDERIEELENEKRELLKKTRELESIFEAERAAVMKDREAALSREEELQSVIQRLKESLSQRDSKGGAEEGGLSRNGTSIAFSNHADR
jgi:chromosome segregation ATPase